MRAASRRHMEAGDLEGQSPTNPTVVIAAVHDERDLDVEMSRKPATAAALARLSRTPFSTAGMELFGDDAAHQLRW